MSDVEEIMAEAVVENPVNSRFFCHECNRVISPTLPDYTCPQCEGGFVEQMTTDESSNDDNQESVDTETPDPAADFAELWGRVLFGPSTSDDTDNRRRSRGLSRPRIAIRRLRAGAQGGATGNAAEAAAIDLIIQNLLGIPGMVQREDGPSGSSNNQLPLPLRMLHLHGNPGDYAWGSNGLDSIITQLLNQLEGTGPPPASNDKIDGLPTITVSQSVVDARTECAICQEQLTLNEEVKGLPCKHLYHKDCIEPWLNMHDSCPICRLSLSKNQTRSWENTE